jgi:hypothetical protein
MFLPIRADTYAEWGLPRKQVPVWAFVHTQIKFVDRKKLCMA